MKVYVITECRFDESGQLKIIPFVRMASRAFDKAYGWFKATYEAQISLNKLLDEGGGDLYTMDGAWFSYSSNYGGVYEETIVSFNAIETR